MEHIVLPPEEVLPRDTGPGEPVHLAYMPVTLLLRDPDASWMLADTSVPSLPDHVSRRGLFQLRPSTVYIRRHISKDQTMYVRRTQFPVMPADVRIVYAAQGSTYPAVVADMQRPPRMSLETHWLACYVMLSRATSLEGFLAMRLAAREELGHRPPMYLVDEITRLLQLEKESTKALRAYLEWLPAGAVPDSILALFEAGAEAAELRRVTSVRSANLGVVAESSSALTLLDLLVE